MPCVGPGGMLAAIAQILGAAAPTVAVIINSRDLKIAGHIIGLQGQGHAGDRRIGFSGPAGTHTRFAAQSGHSSRWAYQWSKPDCHPA